MKSAKHALDTYQRWIVLSTLVAAFISGCSAAYDVPSCIKKHVNNTESTLAQLVLNEACETVYGEGRASSSKKSVATCLLDEVSGSNNWVAATAAIEYCNNNHGNGL